ncbi:MAG TPA: nuclear transport factor 2 family protein [Novosphingobium sp.]|nr:nuclear transport factor 2 family protein [Novosphingobium sp.]
MMPRDIPINPRRRLVLAVAALAGAVPAAAFGGEARGGSGRRNWPEEGDILDKLRIADLVQRERAARDAGEWEEMAACYHPQSTVDVSWYRGDGAGFVAASRRNAASGRISVHQLTPTVVTVAGTRALAETPCQLLTFAQIEGIEVCMVGTVRLLWRSQMLNGGWTIAGLRIIYIRDYLVPASPTQVPLINEAELAGYRTSYRFLSYILARSPNGPRQDLPGVDRAESVEALRAGEKKWLEEK